jgi:hypothetical protein
MPLLLKVEMPLLLRAGMLPLPKVEMPLLLKVEMPLLLKVMVAERRLLSRLARASSGSAMTTTDPFHPLRSSCVEVPKLLRSDCMTIQHTHTHPSLTPSLSALTPSPMWSPR